MDAIIKKKALSLIILFGLVSLFGDMAYEGARSVNGPYLKLLAVNAVTLGFISGLGEFLGYGIRLISGYLSDKTKSYWLLTFLGYGLMISVPLLSLAGIWQVAAAFIIMERIGKAIRSPARDTILSQASSQVGTGFGFGLHEAMDQIGAFAGPLVFSVLFMLSAKEGIGLAAYQRGYSFLWIPFLLVMLFLFISYKKVPYPAALERTRTSEKLSKVFWLYTLFTFVATLGFCTFILLAFHFKSAGILTDAQIPLYYAIAMGIDAAAALAAGKLYDVLKARTNNHHGGLNVLAVIPALTILMPLCVFSSNRMLVVAGILCWGIIMGIHETIMRSAIADITSFSKRGTGYGIFNTTYGLAVFTGSVVLGFLYDRSITSVVAAIIVTQISAFVIFLRMRSEVIQKSRVMP